MQNFPCSFEFHLLSCLGYSSMAMATEDGKRYNDNDILL